MPEHADENKKDHPCYMCGSQRCIEEHCDKLYELRNDILEATVIPKELIHPTEFEMNERQKRFVQALVNYFARFTINERRQKANIQMNRFFDGMVK